MSKEKEINCLKIPSSKMRSCFHFEMKKLDLYNLSKEELKRICNGLKLLKESTPEDKKIKSMLNEYIEYLKCFE